MLWRKKANIKIQLINWKVHMDIKNIKKDRKDKGANKKNTKNWTISKNIY